MKLWEKIEHASDVLRDSPIIETPLELNERLSGNHECTVLLKREDHQEVNAFKGRGAWYMMSQLEEEEKKRGVVCASAGNHAQGVANACREMEIPGIIFMPENAPKAKVDATKRIGGDWVEIRLVGKRFDDAKKAAESFCKKEKKTFVHPFDDIDIIAGQGTIAKEILEQAREMGQPQIDLAMMQIGGGGLAAGMSTYFRCILGNNIDLRGAEEEHFDSMRQSIKAGYPITLDPGNNKAHADGTAVLRPGDETFRILKELGIRISTAQAGLIGWSLRNFKQKEGIIFEPSGVLGSAALNTIKSSIKGKVVVCTITGSNVDASKFEEAKERKEEYSANKAKITCRGWCDGREIKEALLSRNGILSAEEEQDGENNLVLLVEAENHNRLRTALDWLQAKNRPYYKDIASIEKIVS